VRHARYYCLGRGHLSRRLFADVRMIAAFWAAGRLRTDRKQTSAEAIQRAMSGRQTGGGQTAQGSAERQTSRTTSQRGARPRLTRGHEARLSVKEAQTEFGLMGFVTLSLSRNQICRRRKMSKRMAAFASSCVVAIGILALGQGTCFPTVLDGRCSHSDAQLITTDDGLRQDKNRHDAGLRQGHGALRIDESVPQSPVSLHIYPLAPWWSPSKRTVSSRAVGCIPGQPHDAVLPL